MAAITNKTKITSFFLAVIKNDLTTTKSFLANTSVMDGKLDTRTLIGRCSLDQLQFERLDFELQTHVFNSTSQPAHWTDCRILHVAARSDNPEMMKLLLENGADPNSTMEGEVTPLMVATVFQRVEIVELLLEWGAEANARTRWGKSALHYAVQAESSWMVQLLLQHGADTEVACDSEKITPLHLAAEAGYGDIALILMRHSANPSSRTNSGATALHYAVAMGDQDLVEAMIGEGARLEQLLNAGNIDLSMFPWLSEDILQDRFRMMERFLPKRRIVMWFYDVIRMLLMKKPTAVKDSEERNKNLIVRRRKSFIRLPNFPAGGFNGFDFDTDL